jgi:glucose-6-phosphate 1-epimerase
MPVPLPAGLREVRLGESGLCGWVIETAQCEALVSAQGAQLLEFRPQGEAPLLWRSPTAFLVPGKAIRGGIPLCFPWFGPHPENPGLPAHGFARTRDWTLQSASADEDAVHLILALEADAASRDLWPFDFRAELQMTLGRRPMLELQVRNTGSRRFRFTFAFHSYFPLQDSRRARVEGLEGATRIDQLDAQRRRRRQHGPLRFDGETDQVFLGVTRDVCLVDEAGGSRIRLSAPDCRSVVAWNPGPEKTARLPDMAPESWSGMACVESGNVEEDAVELAPGAVAQLGLTIVR